MNKSAWNTLRPLQLTSCIALARITIFTATVLICAGTAVQAQLGFNSAGRNIILGSYDRYNGNTSGIQDGYLNYGSVTVNGAEFNQNGDIGLWNVGGAANIEAGTFDNNDEGLYNYRSTADITGGDFDYNSYGLYDDRSTDSTYGGDFDNNYYALYSYYSNDSVSGGSFDNNYYALYSYYSNDSISGGSFDNNYYALYSYYSNDSISGGNFDNNGVGLYSDSTTDSISGGRFENNGYGVDSESSTVTISGGTFDKNEDGLYSDSGSTDTITGGDFQGNSLQDLYAGFGGAIDIYGESFGGLPFGDLPEYSTGSLEWTLSNGTTEDLTYYNGGTIDLIQAAPESSTLISFATALALLCAGIVISRSKQRRDA